MGNIYQAITEIAQEIEPIAKERKNQQQGFMYRGVDEVMNELQPILAKHKVFIVPEVIDQSREERTSKHGGNLIYSILKIKVTFYAEDGSSVSATVIGEGMDSADKASNKAMAVGYKYACTQVFCIPTAEAKDPDGDSPGESKKAPAQNGKGKESGDQPPPPQKTAPEKPQFTRLQKFNAETSYAGLNPEEIKKVVFTICDPFTFSTVKEAVSGASEEDFTKVIQAVRQAAIDKEAANA